MKYIKYIVLISLLILLCCSIYFLKDDAKFRKFLGLEETPSMVSKVVPKLEMRERLNFQ